MSSVYSDIIDSQTKKGNLGGKKGALGKSKKEDSDCTKLKFFVITGKVNQAMDSNGLADPYVTIGTPSIKDGGKPKVFLKTTVKNKTLSPSWSFEQSHFIDTTKYKSLIVEMHDKDFLSSDFIGRCTIDISKIEEQDMLYETYELFGDDKSKSRGEVYLSISKC